MQTQCSQWQLIFEGFGGRQVVGSFDGGAVTSNGGALLLRAADKATGLTAKVASCFRDGRCPDHVVHKIETMVAQCIHGIALGHEDINDHDELRHDPVLGLLSDQLEAKRAGIATLTVRRIKVAFATVCSVRELMTIAHQRLRSATA